VSGRHGLRAASALVWVLLAVVLAVALAFSVSKGGPLTPAQRAAAIDAVLKCPSCDGISVADSSASSAAAVRQVVLARVREGQSDQQIEQYLVSRYGPSILLRPPTTGSRPSCGWCRCWLLSVASEGSVCSSGAAGVRRGAR